MNNLYNEYKYKQELNSADLMMLGIRLEETDNHHNKVCFCNEVFGLFNDRSEVARQQLNEYIDANYTVTSVYPYVWADKVLGQYE